MLMKKCSHPSIVQFLESYLHSGTLWVVMELVEGEDLTQLITSCELHENHIAHITKEVNNLYIYIYIGVLILI